MLYEIELLEFRRGDIRSNPQRNSECFPISLNLEISKYSIVNS